MKILIVDDHAIVRAGLRRLLGTLSQVESRDRPRCPGRLS